MKRIAIYFVITAVVSGCTTTKSVSNIELPQGQTTVFQVPVAVVGEKPSRLAPAYADALRRASSYRTEYMERDFVRGVRTSASENIATVSYLSQYYKNERLKNNFSASFILDIKTAGDAYSVVVKCPSSVVNDVRIEGQLINVMPSFITKEEVVSDVISLCTNASFVFDVTESGEINTEFGDSPTFANFARKLRPYNPKKEEVKQYDLEKSKWFYLPDNNNEYKVAISVFPYRSGSKITYRNVRLVTCKPSQPCDYDKAFAERLRAKLTAIAND